LLLTEQNRPCYIPRHIVKIRSFAASYIRGQQSQGRKHNVVKRENISIRFPTPGFSSDKDWRKDMHLD
jgi:hypothetical protein